MNYVINPISREDLESFLDDKSKSIIRYFILKSLFSQPELKLGQKTLPIQIPKEHIEQWFTQAFNVKPVGAGSYPIDIYNEREHWGADIKMLNIKVRKDGKIEKSDSGEASLGQNFSEAGIDLDSLFKDQRYDQIKDAWVKLFQEKYERLKDNYPSIKKIYYFFILRPGVQTGGTNFYFVGAVLDRDKLDRVCVDFERSTKSSVFLKNFIDSEYGNIKIYKAKKRLELRIRPKIWIENRIAIRISTSFEPFHVNLREEKIDINYLNAQMEKLQNVKVEFQVD